MSDDTTADDTTATTADDTAAGERAVRAEPAERAAGAERAERAGGVAPRVSDRTLRTAGAIGGIALLCALPFYLDAFWLQVGLFSMAAAIGAIGLNLLTGTTGQLSLGHAFFLAVGAYGYVWLAGEPGPGLPPLLAMVLAVLLAGAAGGLFSPIAGRLRGVYLGVATLALVFLGHHVMVNAESVTGGFNGRSVPPLEIGGFTFTSADPELTVLGVPFGAEERLWYVGLVLLALVLFTARNLLHGRQGRALAAVRDSEVAAAVLGVPVARYRSAAFVVSSMYAGLAGVLLALAFRGIVPDHFGLALSIDYLVMIVLGGLGSAAGATAGAVFVTALPLLMARYADQLPLVAPAGAAGHPVGPTDAARYLYGAAVILVLLYAPGGLSGLFRRHHGRARARPRSRTASAVPRVRRAAAPDPARDRAPVPATEPKEQTS